MDVNQLKPQTNLRQSQIRKQLRQRKIGTDNQLAELIEPFKSYRRNHHIQTPLNTAPTQPNIPNDQSQPFKLKRQYPSEWNADQKVESSGKQAKYRYELEGVADENEPPSSSQHFSSFQGIDLKKPEWIRQNLHSLSGAFVAGTGKRKEVQSIIFDSKVTKVQTFQGNSSENKNSRSDRTIANFQSKVDKVNHQIEAGLTHVETLIAELKKKKVARSQIEAQQRQNNRLKELEKEFAQRRALMNSGHSESQPEKLLPESVVGQSVEKGFSNLRKVPDEVADSQIELQGDFGSKEKRFPPEYISFINRLSNQIERDVLFTNRITELTKSNAIQIIRQLICEELAKHQGHPQIDETFFQIEPSEIDPLDQGKPGWYKQYSPTELESQAGHIYKMYKDIQNHYSSKLMNSFSQNTVQLLFQQLTRFNSDAHLGKGESVTVGHLLSYLNMRTNKSFRNRSFVKMLKRLGLKSSLCLSVGSFGQLVRQQ